MIRPLLPAVVLAFAPALAGAQDQLDPKGLQNLEDLELVLDNGDKAGEVESALIDQQGNLVAVAVEVGGFLGIGDDTKIVPMDQLSFQNGNFVTTMGKEALDELAEWDD